MTGWKIRSQIYIMVIVYIVEFLLFSFVGWLIDSAYRSVRAGRLINAGYFGWLVCPIYGVGGLLLMFFYRYFYFLSPPALVILAGLALVLLEFVGGVFSERVLQVKLWDYSDARWHVGGYVDLLHAFYWLALSVIFYIFIFPYLIQLEAVAIWPKVLDLPALALAIVAGVWYTVWRSPARFLELEKQVLNLTVDEYRKIFSEVRKMRKMAVGEARDKLREAVEKRLVGSGARLKK